MQAPQRDEIIAGSLVRLLRTCSSPKKWPILIKILENDPLPFMRTCAAESLDGNTADRAVKALLKATEIRHEDRRVSRAGAAGGEPVHVRIIVASTRDLRDLVNAERFLAELASRLDGEVILVPPLNERREDIPLLATHFARQSGKDIADAAVAMLQGIDWTGTAF